MKHAPAQKADKREQLLDAAEGVLAEKGLAGTTTRAITTRAGCAEGTLYIYFKGRADVFLAIFERRLASAFPQLARLETGAVEPRAALLELATEFLRFHRTSGPLLAGLFAEPELLEKYRTLILSRNPDAPRALPPLVAYLRREQRRKRIAARVDPNVAAEALLGACFARAFHDNMFDDAAGDAADRKFLRGLIGALIG
jgi:AcrR family transcriptional regulator